MKIIVSIRDDSPMLYCEDSPAYRLVEINLSEDQAKKLERRYIGKIGNVEYYEAYSRCYTQEEEVYD